MATREFVSGLWIKVHVAMLLVCLAGACATDRPDYQPDEARVVIRKPWTMPEPPGPDELIVIVARKKSLIEVELEIVLDPERADPEVVDYVILDLVFLARYRVLRTVLGDYERDEIEFLAFDHYGYPEFARTDVVLLPIARYGDEYVHVTYEFEPLRKFLGRWTEPGGRSIHRLAAEWVREFGPESRSRNGQ